MAIAVAILRYRLYEIDVLINSTLIYGPLTAGVAGSYVAAVVLARVSFVGITGERSDSELVVATLIAGEVFWIVRTKMIGLVDRHFKDPRELAKDQRHLRESVRDMTRVIQPSAISRGQLGEYVLEHCVSAFDAEGGRIEFQPGRGPMSPIVVGNAATVLAAPVDISHDGTLFGRLHGSTATEQVVPRSGLGAAFADGGQPRGGAGPAASLGIFDVQRLRSAMVGTRR